MEGFNRELALAQLPSHVISVDTSTTSFYPETPALKFPRAAYTAFSSTPELAPTITFSQSDDIWAGPGWFEILKSESTVYTSQIIEIVEDLTDATEFSSLKPSTAERSSTTSSPRQISQSVHPVHIAQTEDNTLLLEGVGVIETFVSSEISSSVVTLTAFKTIVLTSVSTSMICTCDNTMSPLSATVSRPTTLTNLSRSTSSAPIRFSSSIVQLSAFYSNSTATVSVTQLSTCSSLSPTSTIISISSVLSSIITPVTSTMQSSSSDSTSTTSITTIDSQPSVVPSAAASTVTPVDPPANTVCNSRPPSGYIDVNPDDVGRYADKFCKTVFSQDCPTQGYAITYDSSFVENVVGYNISVNPVSFCSGLSASTCEYPLPNLDYDCSYSLKTAWQNCTTNLGMGGSITAGCLLYSISPIAYCQGSWTDPNCR